MATYKALALVDGRKQEIVITTEDDPVPILVVFLLSPSNEPHAVDKHEVFELEYVNATRTKIYFRDGSASGKSISVTGSVAAVKAALDAAV